MYSGFLLHFLYLPLIDAGIHPFVVILYKVTLLAHAARVVRAIGMLTFGSIAVVALHMVTCVAHEAGAMLPRQVWAPVHALQVLYHLQDELAVLLGQGRAGEVAVLAIERLEVLAFFGTDGQMVRAGLSVDLPRLHLIGRFCLLLSTVLIIVQQLLEESVLLTLLKVYLRQLEHALLLWRRLVRGARLLSSSFLPIGRRIGRESLDVNLSSSYLVRCLRGSAVGVYAALCCRRRRAA